jgi:hypothetical protein
VILVGGRQRAEGRRQKEGGRKNSHNLSSAWIIEHLHHLKAASDRPSCCKSHARITKSFKTFCRLPSAFCLQVRNFSSSPKADKNLNVVSKLTCLQFEAFMFAVPYQLSTGLEVDNPKIAKIGVIRFQTLNKS